MDVLMEAYVAGLSVGHRHDGFGCHPFACVVLPNLKLCLAVDYLVGGAFQGLAVAGCFIRSLAGGCK